MRRGAHKFHGYADEVLERLLAFASSTVAEQLAEQTDAGARRTDGALALAFALAHCLCVERRVIDPTLSAELLTHAAITLSCRYNAELPAVYCVETKGNKPKVNALRGKAAFDPVNPLVR
jgi:hypothetical protein